jgi:heptosyltransferase-3
VQKGNKSAARGNQLLRNLDHIIGTPLLLALSLTRRKRLVPEKISTVGILSCSAIGDTIIASAIARDIKIAFSSCKVIVFISRAAHGVVTIVEGFDEEVDVVITKPFDAVRILRSYPTDVLLDVLPWSRVNAVVVALARSRFTVGFQTDRQHRHYAYDAVVPHLGSRHEVENYRALLAPLGIVGRLSPRARPEFRAYKQHSGASERTVVLHPWASGFKSTMREWPASRWTVAARKMIADGARILITGGPADRDRAEALSAMVDRPGQVTVVAGTSLLETARQMAGATLAISVNTGIMHLAAAMDLNLIALHGPTNPVRWGPLSEKAVVVGPGPSEGGAFLNLGFEYPEDASDCMTLISVDDVLGHARRVLIHSLISFPAETCQTAHC